MCVGDLTTCRRADQASRSNTRINSVQWKPAEMLLLASRVGDLLAIFDCCDAGNLCHFRGPHRFEVLGSCCDGQETPPPGPRSFTTALTWALRKLKQNPIRGKGWFTTPELRDKIKSYHRFPQDQWPHLGHRELESAALGHIVIAPTTPNATAADNPSPNPPLQDSNLHFLDLRFHFHGDIDEEALENLAGGIRPLVSMERINAKRVTFVAKGSVQSILRKALNKWQDVTRANRDRKNGGQEQLAAGHREPAPSPMTPASDPQSKFVSDVSDADTDRRNSTIASDVRTANSNPTNLEFASPSKRPK